MKRFFGFLLFLAILLGVAYFWWQQNANRIMTEQVQRIAKSFFTNPERLSVKADGVRLTGLRTARVSSLVISGSDLQLKNGPAVQYAKVELKDVAIAGPPFHLADVGSGAYVMRATDTAVTQYLQQRGGQVAGIDIIPLNTLSVTFQPGPGAPTKLQGRATVPLLDQGIPFTVTGSLVPSNSHSQIDFRMNTDGLRRLHLPINVSKVEKALNVINPVVDLSSWPIVCDVQQIQTKPGVVIVQGKVIGANGSLF